MARTYTHDVIAAMQAERARGWSQQEIASRLGVSVTAVTTQTVEPPDEALRLDPDVEAKARELLADNCTAATIMAETALSRWAVRVLRERMEAEAAEPASPVEPKPVAMCRWAQSIRQSHPRLTDAECVAMARRERARREARRNG